MEKRHLTCICSFGNHWEEGLLNYKVQWYINFTNILRTSFVLVNVCSFMANREELGVKSWELVLFIWNGKVWKATKTLCASAFEFSTKLLVKLTIRFLWRGPKRRPAKLSRIFVFFIFYYFVSSNWCTKILQQYVCN